MATKTAPKPVQLSPRAVQRLELATTVVVQVLYVIFVGMFTQNAVAAGHFSWTFGVVAWLVLTAIGLPYELKVIRDGAKQGYNVSQMARLAGTSSALAALAVSAFVLFSL